MIVMRHPTRRLSLLLELLAVALLFHLPTEIEARRAVMTPEELFRLAARKWQQKNSYLPWVDFSKSILQRFDKEPAVSTSSSKQKQQLPRLELIGALEESILMIEKSTLHEGDNKERDAALSQLYAAYGYTLMELSPHECYMLAMDPHTLLIGADTVKQQNNNNKNDRQDDENNAFLCVDNAENSLRNAATLDATNESANGLLDKILKGSAAGAATAVHARKPKEFVAELFDSFADTFDEKLLKGLHYRVPMLVGEVVNSIIMGTITTNTTGSNNNPEKKFRNALDAGCGTGLAGRFLRPHVARKLIGVDASQKMLDIAAKCTRTSGCGLETTATVEDAASVGNNKDDNSLKENISSKPLYDGLLAMDLEVMTVANTLHHHQDDNDEEDDGFDLIVAADVLVYFGSLDNLIRTFATVSVPGSILIFSCERTTVDEAPLGWRLLPSGRFAHTKEHVLDAAHKAGYHNLLVYQEIVPRMEKGEDVQGHLFGFELAVVSEKKNKTKQQGSDNDSAATAHHSEL